VKAEFDTQELSAIGCLLPSTLLLPTSVSAPARPVVARLRPVIIARLWSVVIARLVIGAIKVCMPRGSAVAGAAVARTVIDTLAAVVRLTVIGTLVAVVRLRLLIPLVEVVKQKRERKRNAPADLSLSWTLGGKEQTACCEQNNERFHALSIISGVTARKGKYSVNGIQYSEFRNIPSCRFLPMAGADKARSAELLTRNIPGSIAMIVVSVAFHLEKIGIKVVEEMASGLPRFGLPDVSWGDVPLVLWVAVSLRPQDDSALRGAERTSSARTRDRSKGRMP
jgi:hypothetical protein